jgi:outer membrane lipoprotein carrier protein
MWSKRVSGRPLPGSLVRFRFMTLFAALVLATSIGTAQASPENPTTTAELVAGVKSAYANVSSVRADFTQTVTNAAMGTPDRQRGKLAIEKPRKIRVDLGVPLQSSVVSDGKTLWMYSVAQKQVIETPEVTAGSEVSALLEDLAHLDEHFEVTLLDDKPPKPTHTVRLVPRKQGNFKSIQITLSRQKYLLQELVLVDQLENTTTMDFTNLRMNTDVPDTEFVFQVPQGVQVIKTGSL